MPCLLCPLCLKLRAGNRHEIEVPGRSQVRPELVNSPRLRTDNASYRYSSLTFVLARERLTEPVQTGFVLVVLVSGAQLKALAVSLSVSN